jgi:hypothetical protein
MSVQASVVLTTARTLLNDDGATVWTDTALLPKLAQAHRELQAKLKLASVPVMKSEFTATITANSTTIASPPTDLREPIRIWEKLPSDPVSNYLLMTEQEILPNIVPVATLGYWSWKDEVITFIGATVDRFIRMQYWRTIAIPASNTDPVGFIDAELYLAPRVAALAAGSTGEEKMMASLASIAADSLNDVIQSNRGRGRVSQGAAVRP